jgi:ABC-type branched-subunit amino acid transport system permease subunit
MILYALLLITTMVLRPQGLLGNRELDLARLFARPGARRAPP